MSLYAPPDVGRRLLPNDARRLIFPLGISLVLHALVFWSADEVSPSPDSSAARQNKLQASLLQKPAAEPIEKPLFSPAQAPENAPVRQPEKPVDASPDSQPASESAAESPPEPEQVEAQPSLPVEPVRTGIDVAGLRQYHMALGQKARLFRRYPEEARAAGWGGQVKMRLFISETGTPLGISLLSSSGFAILDRAALEMMLLSAGHTEVPESLRGRSFNIDLGIDYNPEDAP